MSRIIIEDIRLNKKKKVIPKKEETVFVVEKKDSNEIFKDKILTSKSNYFFSTKPKNKNKIQRTPQAKKESGGFNKYILLLLILSFFIGVFYWGSIYFKKADINISAKHQLITYSSKLFNVSSESNGDTDNIMIVIYPDKKTKKIILTEPTEVSVKAKGSITLYNTFGTTPQKLLPGTFISDNEGKSYKTDSTVTIPGYKIGSDKKIIPGEVVVGISAFLPGDAYNGSPSDFYVSTFKGTSKYNKIYGKLKNPLVGGASGIVYKLSDSDIKNIDNMANSIFKNDLIKKVEASIYSGYILYPNAMTFSYKINDDVYSKTPETEVTIDGVLSVVLIKEKTLINSIVKISLPEIKENELKEISVNNINNLTFSFSNKDQVISKDMSSVSFYLSGDIDAVWNPDIELLKTKLLGMSKTDAPSVFRQDPGISSAIVKVFPPWEDSIPDDVSKINIILK